jgi:hypothetical protein
MLVPSMNNKEVTAEIMRDVEKFKQSTFKRVMEEYDRERKKHKIDNTKPYFKAYPIRSASKNNWILYVRKICTSPKYKNLSDAELCSFTYYYSDKGFRVFRYQGVGSRIEVYNGHFFKRYNERMGLNLPNPLAIAKEFFKNCEEIKPAEITEGDLTYNMVLCHGGFALGQTNLEANWLIFNTFISNDLQRQDQVDLEKRIISDYQKEPLIEQETPQQAFTPINRMTRPVWAMH